ncbi:MAG: MotA/TolQ/ExbB proton channel family protein [Pseudomonadales bacterium]|nr:MotA/TolQ/ExbB proton channel family protein [Pseudomonadales bacterium]
MLEIVQAGGWLMVPILLCSVVAAAISVERLWSMQRSRILPRDLLAQTWNNFKQGDFDQQKSRDLRTNSPLGQVLAAGVVNTKRGREIMKEAMEEATIQVNHELERYLTALGIIASIAPLLGLLGTVVGMIDVFDSLLAEGAGNANVLAGGISTALITTAAGMSVAIPALIFHRIFLRRVDEMIVDVENEASKFVDMVHGNGEILFDEPVET